MSVVLVGANPGVLVKDGDRVTAFASVWQVDWSVRGSGPALVLWHAGRVRVLGPDPDLAGWLADTFVRHFGEVGGLPWEPAVERADVDVDLDLARGLRAKAADVTVEMSGVTDRRPFRQEDLTLGTTAYDLSNVFAPCSAATVTVGGTAVPGAPDPAFLAVAEVWSTPAGS
jgi:hypothetical protein